ncbi:MAG: DUF2793 domain-containing protein [Sphingomicrobium sp.]
MAGQAQKEITHNEALQTLDTIVAAAAEEGPRDDPPPSPALSACYIVGTTPTGAWAGKPLSVAAYTSGGWRFVIPVDGMTVFVKSQAVPATYRQGAWEIGVLRGSSVLIGGQQVVGARMSAIPPAAGGTTIDSEARGAIDQILVALRQHGLIDP